MKRPLVRAFAVIAAFGFVAAACGGDDDTTSDTTGDTTADTTAETTADTSDAGEYDLGGRTITVAVENAYLPFNYIDADTGEPAGWDYETIDEICARLNCVPDYQTFAWEPMIQAVADGQFDMAADGITITDERAQIVDFSDGYIAIEQRLLVALGSGFTSVQDVIDDGCQVVSQVGTTNYQTAVDTFGEDRVTALEDFGFVVQSVIAGDNCAAVIDETAGQGYVGANADAVELIGDSLSSDQLGFIFPKGSDLVAAFNWALSEMKADGTLEEISSKYFGDSFTITYDDIADPNAGESADGGDGELKIGYVLPQTGALSSIIDALVKPLEMGEQEIKAAGGSFTLIPGDSGTDPNVATATVDQLLNDGVDAIIGPAATGVTLAVIDKITGSNIVECSGSTTGAVFSTYDDGGYYFRMSPPDSLQGPALADVITDDGASNVAIIHLNNEYGAGLAGFIAGGLDDNGVGVAGLIPIDEGATSYDAEIGQLGASGADAVVVITYGEGVALMQGMIEAGLGPSDIATYVTDGFKDSVTAAQVDPDNPGVLAGIRGTAPSVAPPDGEPTFLTRLEAFAPGTPTIFSAHFYDCLNVIVLASEAAGTDDPSVFVDDMLTVTNDGTECFSYAECSELLAAGEDINYQGASGVVDLDAAGEPSAGTYDVFEYDAESNPVTQTQVSFSNS
jgi:branched-chain amino acid transport system substrate-binding protein